MRRFLILAAGLSLPVLAQPAKGPGTAAAPAAALASASGTARPPGAQRIFVLKYADPIALADVLRVFGATVVANTGLHAVAVASTFPDVIASVDDAINRLDVPGSAPQNIELTAYYIIGGTIASPLGSALPKDLDPAAGELSKTSAYKNYRLLDALTIRMRTGQGAATAGTAGTVGAGSPQIATDFQIRAATLSTDSASVRIDRLAAGVKMPVAAGGNQYSVSDLTFDADLDVKPNQLVIAGRTGMNKDQALFLVLTARVVK